MSGFVRHIRTRSAADTSLQGVSCAPDADFGWSRVVFIRLLESLLRRDSARPALSYSGEMGPGPSRCLMRIRIGFHLHSGPDYPRAREYRANNRDGHSCEIKHGAHGQLINVHHRLSRDRPCADRSRGLVLR